MYQNPNADPTVNATQAQSNDAANYVVTGDRTKAASVNLISDTANFGVGDFVRGWSMSKQGSQADLAFTYSNNDTSGLAARGANTVMNLNGFDNQVEFPTATNVPLPTNSVARLVWAGDTNLYRDSANTLKTDDNLVVGTLTPAGVVHNDVAGLLSTSLIVNADISASAAIDDTKLATVSTAGKVSNSATTATSTNTPNTIVLRDSSGDFNAGTITANLIGNASTASTAISAPNFTGSLSGDVTGTQGATIVSFVGGQSAINIAAATIAANAATPTNTPSTIVKRDALGDFIAGTITANLTGDVTGNLSGNATSATTAANTVNFSGTLSGNVTGTQGATVVNDVGGQTAASIAAATILANAATSNNTAGAIVRRDGAGGFSAGTITANLNGASSLNVLKAGDTMTGALTLPAGTNPSPSLRFSGSTGTGLATSVANVLSLVTSGTQRMSVSNTAVTTAAALILTNILCDQASQSIIPTTGGAVTVNSGISVLILRHTNTVNNFTITFPPNPTDGQHFTIFCASTFSISPIVNAGGVGGAAIVNGITGLNPAANFTATANGSSVTYYYVAAANAWYKYGRG